MISLLFVCRVTPLSEFRGRGLFAFALLDVLRGQPEIAFQKLRIFPHFLSPGRRQNTSLAPYIFMPVKAVDPVEGLTFEREREYIENEPRIMSMTPRLKPAPQPAALIQISLLTI